MTQDCDLKVLPKHPAGKGWDRWQQSIADTQHKKDRYAVWQ